MTPEELAAVHARAFAGQARGWSVQEFRDLLSRSTIFIVGDAQGFAMGQVVADEAELLTLATAPDAQRQGRGRACLEAFENEARARGAARLFLEVAADNRRALTLYTSAGFTELARRLKYYKRPEGGPVDALTLEKRLS